MCKPRSSRSHITLSLACLSTVVASLGFTPSSQAAGCVSPPANLVAWWPLDGQGTDVVGNHIYTNVGTLSTISGEVGLAYEFETVPCGIAVSNSPDLNFGAGADFSIEAWIKPETASTSFDVMDIVDKRLAASVGSAVGYELYLGSGRIAFQMCDSLSKGVQTGGLVGPDLRDGAWHHVAVTVTRAATDGGNLYVDGVVVATFDPTGYQGDLGNTEPLLIGLHPNYPQVSANFKGDMDEVSLYSRALSSAEIHSIYLAGSGGKCATPFPPFILAQPADQNVLEGQTATFSVLAGGTSPLSYQWSVGGLEIPSATNAVLTLSNVRRSDAGSYFVTVSNSLGSVVSSNATLTVDYPPALVWLPSASAASGNLLGDTLVTLPVYLVANGDENALGFSLSFSPSVLSNVTVELGSGAAGGSLLVNANSASNGVLGVALSLPAGTTFSPGTQEVARVTFAIPGQPNATSSAVTFGDNPLSRELSDAAGHVLAVDFAGGVVTVSVAFEADTSPRSNGDNNVTITDWVLLGRYSAHLDYPTNASEFQRADCAPRSTLGDGLITVGDWVQAGRYAARLDPLTQVGGPSVEVTGAMRPMPKLLGDSARQLRVAGGSIIRGQTGTALVELQAQGDENALGFSLSFDPQLVAYTGAILASASGGAVLQVNAKEANSGRIGFVLALPAGSTFAQGNSQLIGVRFAALSTVSVTSPVLLGDQPVPRDIVDAKAGSLSAQYVNGSITINPIPTLVISTIGQDIKLTWPAWASNYVLEATGPQGALNTWTNLPVSPVITGDQMSATLPIQSESRFYRLRLP